MTRQETAEDKAAKDKVHQIKGEDGTMLKLKVDKLLGRRKLKKDYEYEVGKRERGEGGKESQQSAAEEGHALRLRSQRERLLGAGLADSSRPRGQQQTESNNSSISKAATWCGGVQ